MAHLEFQTNDLAVKSKAAAPAGNAISILEILQAATDAHQKGDLDAAEKGYRRALKKQPKNVDALQLLGVLTHQKGNSKKGLQLLGKALKIDPENIRCHNNIGSIYNAVGDYKKAETHFMKATQGAKVLAEAWFNLGLSQRRQGRIMAALESISKAHQEDPGYLPAIREIGAIHVELHQFEEAEKFFRNYLSKEPDDVGIANNLAYVVQMQGRMGEAEALFKAAMEKAGNSPHLGYNMRTLLLLQGREEEARELFRQQLRENPESWSSELGLALGLALQGMTKEALANMGDMLNIFPDNARVWGDVGYVLMAMEKHAQALTVLQRATEIDPTIASTFNNLGSVYSRIHAHHDAVKNYKKAISLDPNHINAYLNASRSLRTIGEYDQALLFGRAALELETYGKRHFAFPLQLFRGTCDYEYMDRLGSPWENAKLIPKGELPALFLDFLVFSETHEDHKKFFDLVHDWAEFVESTAARMPLPKHVRTKPHDKVRIGWLSSDLRSHSVSKFLMPIMQNYDRDRFEFYCYSAVKAVGDTPQNLIRQAVDKFTFVHDKTDREIAIAIQEDEVDILLELNGFTNGARLEALAYKAAPVQMSWLGYPFTCGLKEIDHIVLNQYLDGPKGHDYLVEEPVNMPESWVCFGKFADAPILPDLPMDRNGIFTFGTLNNVYKYTPSMIANWAEVLKRKPDSRFMIIRPEVASHAVCKNLTEEFAKNGVSSDRLYFLNNHAGPKKKHLDYYNEIDLSLDTYPLTGGTTTCEAVWMGVPVVSLVGDLFHQRLSYSVLMQCGLEEFCTTDRESFINCAVDAANNPDHLRYLRQNLREVVSQSPLCDGDRFVFQFQEMLEAVADHHKLR